MMPEPNPRAGDLSVNHYFILPWGTILSKSGITKMTESAENAGRRRQLILYKE
jgi:hypothetical protein